MKVKPKPTKLFVDHTYLDPAFYDLTLGHDNYDVAYQSAAMVTILASLRQLRKITLLEIASGPISLYEPYLRIMAPYRWENPAFDLIKTDFVGKKSRNFIVADLANKPLPNLNVDVVLAPYHSLCGMIRANLSNDLDLMKIVIQNSITALRPGGRLLIHFTPENYIAKYVRECNAGEVVDIFDVPPNSAYRKYGPEVKHTYRFDTSTFKKDRKVSQYNTLYFPASKTTVSTRNPIQLILLKHSQYIDLMKEFNLHLESQWAVAEEPRDNIVRTTDNRDACWMMFKLGK